jgi:toxin FitB
MFLIDTNVISESRKVNARRAAPQVTEWLRATDPITTFISAMTIFELELGIMRVVRRDPVQGGQLRGWLDRVVKPTFAGRILPMDERVAATCAAMHVPDPASERDAWIAATALVHSLTVVTRNIGDFQSTGVKLFNPWD